MVSLLSFFTGKKKSRRAPSPPPTNGHSASTVNGSTSPKARTSRFLSLRHKGSGRPAPYDLSNRRASSEVARKRSQRKKDGTSELPRLALGWETANGSLAARSSLGLEGVGLPPRLTDEEKSYLEKRKFSLDEAAQGWKHFGEALKTIGLDTPAIFLPGKLPVDREHQYLMLALISLTTSTSPDQLPSVSSHYLSRSTNKALAPADWLSHLTRAILDTVYPADAADCLKFIIHRTQTASQHSTGALEVELYNSFLHAERTAGYPVDAYTSLLVPRIPVSLRSYLEEVFGLWATIAAHSEANGLQGGRIAKLLGWWMVSSLSSARSLQSWSDLYSDWSDAAKRTEHVFYAWIRDQSRKETLPTRLSELVEDYPFGEAQSGDNFLPQPPATSFDRRVLHITLETEDSVSNVTSLDLLEAIMRSRLPEKSLLPIWATLRPGASGWEDLVTDETVRTYSASADLHAIPAHAVSRVMPSVELPSTEERPSDSVPSSPGEFQQQRSLGNAQVLELGPPITMTSGSLPDPRPVDQPSQSLVSPASSSSDSWDMFTSSGFSDAPKDRLQLSPKTLAVSPPSTLRNISFDSTTTEKPHKPTKSTPSSRFTASSEEIISLDDLFLPFVQDCQQDPAITSTLPKFALVPLRSPFPHNAGAIEWILITAKYVVPRPAESPVSISERPASPAESNLNKSLGFFRRSSSSYGMKSGSRLSLFGGARSPKTSPSTVALATLSESGSEGKPFSSDNGPSTAVSDISTNDKASRPTSEGKVPLPSSAINTGAQPEHLNPAGETKACEWRYRAEGRAHLVFECQGSESAYHGRILRVRKPTSPVQGHDEASRVWKEDLLPKLVPANLLLTSKKVELEVNWARVLLEAAEEVRPHSRKEESGSLLASLSGPIMGAIMDDTTSSALGEADMTLAVEIKPKWGFLPRADSIIPEEAVPIKSQISRYVLHQNLRPDPSQVGYDPIDLFSGEETRMYRAVDALWEIWKSSGGSKSSWKIYVNGKGIKPDQVEEIPCATETGSLTEKTAPLIVPALAASGALDVLKNLQSSLDAMDISTLAQRYQTENNTHDLFDPAHIAEPTSEELAAFVDKYLADTSAGSQDGAWTLREQMIAFSLSAIFKDCSIFVTVPLRKDGTIYTPQPGGKVKIIDLDLKDMKTLRKWYDLDKKIWEHWRDTHQTSPPEQNSPLDTTSNQDISATGLDDDSALSSSIPKASRAEATSETSEVTPTKGSFDSRSVRSAGGADLSFADALAITPSRPTFDPAQKGQTMMNSLMESPTKSTFSITELTHLPSAQRATDVYNPAGPNGQTNPLDVDDDEEGVEVESRPDTTSLTAAERQKRSLAPSPSPTPFMSDLPEDLVKELNSSAASFAEGDQGVEAEDQKANRDEGLTDGIANMGLGEAATAVVAGATALIGSAAAQISDLLPNEDSEISMEETPERDAHANDTSTSSEPFTPSAVATVKENESFKDPEITASRSDTPFETFSTPMTELSDPTNTAYTLPPSSVPGVQSMREEDRPIGSASPTADTSIGLADRDTSVEIEQPESTPKAVSAALKSDETARTNEVNSQYSPSFEGETQPTTGVPHAEDLPVAPSTEPLVVTEFQPHSLPPVIERGESTLDLVEQPSGGFAPSSHDIVGQPVSAVDDEPVLPSSGAVEMPALPHMPAESLSVVKADDQDQTHSADHSQELSDISSMPVMPTSSAQDNAHRTPTEVSEIFTQEDRTMGTDVSSPDAIAITRNHGSAQDNHNTGHLHEPVTPVASEIPGDQTISTVPQAQEIDDHKTS